MSRVCLLRKMWTKAVEWAKANNRFRVNSVHGEDEIKVVLAETFDMEQLVAEETTQCGSFDVEA